LIRRQPIVEGWWQARGILYENQDKEKIWRFYDELLSTAT